MKRISLFFILYFIFSAVNAQDSDSLKLNDFNDSTLRIRNLSPLLTLHVDSSLRYQFEINKNMPEYYWFLSDAPVGLKIEKDNGLLTFKASKNYFLSGRLKYDQEYKVGITVQNLNNPGLRLDTSFRLIFFNTEILPSKIKPSVTNTLYMEEGDTINFRLQCDDGSFPIDHITYISNYPVKSLSEISKCGDEFTWHAPYDFVKENASEKILELYFIGFNKFHQSDTAKIEVVVRENINYPLQAMEFESLRNEISGYIVQLKGSFREVDRKIKRTRRTRTRFDLASASTALGGTIFSSLPNESQQTTGKILPSVGVALVPVKEATVPNNNYEQNTASLIRNSIKRLEYMLADNQLSGPRDPGILEKSKRLRDELKQIQIQLIDIPITDEVKDKQALDEYFNNPKVNKKYRLKKGASRN